MDCAMAGSGQRGMVHRDEEWAAASLVEQSWVGFSDGAAVVERAATSFVEPYGALILVQVVVGGEFFLPGVGGSGTHGDGSATKGDSDWALPIRGGSAAEGGLGWLFWPAGLGIEDVGVGKRWESWVAWVELGRWGGVGWSGGRVVVDGGGGDSLQGEDSNGVQSIQTMEKHISVGSTPMKEDKDFNPSSTWKKYNSWRIRLMDFELDNLQFVERGFDGGKIMVNMWLTRVVMLLWFSSWKWRERLVGFHPPKKTYQRQPRALESSEGQKLKKRAAEDMETTPEEEEEGGNPFRFQG